MGAGKKIALCCLAIVVFLPLGCARKAETVARPFPKTAFVPAGQEVRKEEVAKEDVVVRKRTAKVAEEDLAAKRRAKKLKKLAKEAKRALGKVHFDYDKSDLTSESRQTLIENAAWLKARSELKIQIEGHCDERGTNEYNLALGERRANACKRYMESLGLDPGQTSIISYGEERPADSGRTENAWAKNRRAEFKVSAR